MNLREIEESDITQVARWNVQLHEDEGSIPLSVDAAAERLRRWFAAGRFQGVIFLVGGNPIGYLLYELRPVHADLRAGESVYIRQFFISRESRRQGHGSVAIRSFLRDQVSEIASVVLDVKATNPSGQQFWQSLGFKAKSVAFELDVRREV